MKLEDIKFKKPLPIIIVKLTPQSIVTTNTDQKYKEEAAKASLNTVADLVVLQNSIGKPDKDGVVYCETFQGAIMSQVLVAMLIEGDLIVRPKESNIIS